MPEILKASPSQIQRACTRTRLMAYCREGQVGFTVYVEHPDGRKSFYGATPDDAWLAMGQAFANQSSGFLDAVRYFIRKDLDLQHRYEQQID